MLATFVLNGVLRLKPRKVRSKIDGRSFCTPKYLIQAALEEVDTHHNGAKA